MLSAQMENSLIQYMVRKTLKVVDVDTSYDDVVDEVVGNADDETVEDAP